MAHDSPVSRTPLSTHREAADEARRAKPWFALNAAVAWAGLALHFVVTATGMYPTTNPNTMVSRHPLGAAGALGRIGDFFSYFTIWSTIIVAVVMTMLATNPRRDSPLLRFMRFEGLLMSSMTGAVYQLVLASGAGNRGWEIVSNGILHQVAPTVTILVWLAKGPRRRIAPSTVWAALGLPLVYFVYTLIRGAVIGVYPYPFLDVPRIGVARTATHVATIAGPTVILGFVFMTIERLRSRTSDA